MRILERSSFDSLLEVLRRRGYEVIGPTVRQGAVSYEAIESAEDMPIGLTDEQEGGSYRLRERDDEALFGFNNGANSWKNHLFPPVLTLSKGQRDENGEIRFTEEDAPRRPYAFVGVRSCDLAAILIQDRVFIGDAYVNTDYESRRRDAFIVAVNCAEAGNTCFCASMDTGPRAKSGFDLALTEIVGDDHRFLVEVGSERGEEVLAEVGSLEATERDCAEADAVSERCASQMGREIETDGIKDLIYRNMENPRWDEVSERCLSCGNCTLVCPTCFCHSVDDTTDLAGAESEQTRRWDSCFGLEHSYVHGGSIRASESSRYRQWMTHKLATWIDQFGTSGCVGCGRCITWCPVAIDITEEAAVIRATDQGEARGIDADH